MCSVKLYIYVPRNLVVLIVTVLIATTVGRWLPCFSCLSRPVRLLRAVLRALQVKLMFPLRCCTQTMLAPESASIMLEATPVEEHEWHPDRSDPMFAQIAWATVENLQHDHEKMVRMLFEYVKEETYQREVNKFRCRRRRNRKRKGPAASPNAEYRKRTSPPKASPPKEAPALLSPSLLVAF